MKTATSVIPFILAGFCEIGGGYLLWLWLRNGKAGWYGVVGGIILFLYGVVATLHPAHFGRVYAAFGGNFIIMPILLRGKVDNFVPGKFDRIDGVFALTGKAVMMYAPGN